MIARAFRPERRRELRVIEGLAVVGATMLICMGLCLWIAVFKVLL